MSVTTVSTNAEELTLTLEARYAAPPARVWKMFQDPRLLERWWGPPTYPATFVAHDLTPGGRSSYFMTGPGGDRPHGWWRILVVDEPHGLEFESGFADEDGAPVAEAPVMRMRVSLSDLADVGTEMTIVATFASPEQMERILQMGMREGLTGAVEQIDALLA